MTTLTKLAVGFLAVGLLAIHRVAKAEASAGGCAAAVWPRDRQLRGRLVEPRGRLGNADTSGGLQVD